MKEHLAKFSYECKIVGGGPWVLLTLSLALVALLHGVLAPAALWRRHFIENCEVVFPVALALATGPLILTDVRHQVVGWSGRLPRRRVLHLRWLAIWGPFVGVAAVISIAMAEFWGPVQGGPTALAVMGPAAMLSGLAVCSTSYSGRAGVGYLVAVGLPATDFVLHRVGIYALAPALQWIDCLAFRWPEPWPGWAIVCWVQLGFGLLLIEYTILVSNSLYHGINS